MMPHDDAAGRDDARHRQESIAIEANESGGQKATDPHPHWLFRARLAGGGSE
jgi:hypothetical protein